MLDKLGLYNRYFVIFLLFFIISCGYFKSPPIVNTEIYCPSKNYRLLVKFATVEDVKRSIQGFYLMKKREKDKVRYTVLKLLDGRSIMLRNIPPELAIKCYVREVPYGAVDSTYIISPRR